MEGLLRTPFSYLNKDLMGRVSVLSTLIIKLRGYVTDVFRHLVNEGFSYLRGLFIIFFCDALTTDDEPLWEPLE